jgi:hypothetical protein
MKREIYCCHKDILITEKMFNKCEVCNISSFIHCQTWYNWSKMSEMVKEYKTKLRLKKLERILK